jgi:hypothetical protein
MNIEISYKGRPINVEATTIGDQTIIVTGKYWRTASLHDEVWRDGELIGNPALFIRELKQRKCRADVLTFGQKLPHITPKYDYSFEWDNVAAVPLTTFDDWWQNRATQVTRKNVRRSQRRGVVVRPVILNDELIRGIVEVYNTDKMRQGIRNAHFGKSFDTLKREVSTYTEVSDFLGAYFEDSLIGYLKLVYVGPVASIMNIVCKNVHHDKRPANALLAKAVEVACSRSCSFLVYGKYAYGNKTNSPLTEFKRRNGFECIRFPQYFVPLTARGKLVIHLGLHRGLLGILPGNVIDVLLNIRRKLYNFSLIQKLLFGQTVGCQVADEN